jgi:hypothetical protein
VTKDVSFIIIYNTNFFFFFCLSSLLCACMLFSFVHFTLLSFFFSVLKLFTTQRKHTPVFFFFVTNTHTYTYTSILYYDRKFSSSVFFVSSVSTFSFLMTYIGNFLFRFLFASFIYSGSKWKIYL